MKHDSQGISWSLLSAIAASDIPSCLGRNASWPLLMLMLASGFMPSFQVGDRVSAIATHPEHRTSEPAINMEVRPQN